MNFSENVTRILSEKDISQSELSRIIGKTRSNISMLLKTSRKPSYSTIERFAEALGVTVSDLISESQCTLSDRLRLLMEESQTSAYRIASEIKISESTISRALSKKTTLSDRNTYLIAMYFGVNPEWLKTGDGPKTPIDTFKEQHKSESNPKFDIISTSQREQLSAMFMQSFLTRSNSDDDLFADFARQSVLCADLLIENLNR